MRKSDEEIIALVRDENKEAFSVLVERYQKQVYNLMYRYSRSESDAADLTQEVFLRVYAKLDSFKMGHSFFSWLYSLALNMARDWYRKRTRKIHNRKEMNSSQHEPLETGSHQEIVLLHRENIDSLQKAMEKLPHETREILMLRYNHECSVKDTAKIFSISESAVKMRTVRGLEQLREFMKGEDK